MQRTLFLYIFRDLLKVFLLTSGALAGIMSFGGLLRPLTQRGLDLAQVSQMLAYFMPAMTNYSWPIAALFASTFVYGRLSADNELTACRAAGLSYIHILLPAALLGTVVTLFSGVFLAWVVPHSFLKVEQVIYSNLAKLVAGEIERTQRINLSSGNDTITVFAHSAQLAEPNAANPHTQLVRLDNVVIVKYARQKDKHDERVPLEFYAADSADAFIQMPNDAEADISLFTQFHHGEKIPATPVGELPPGVDPSQSQIRARVESSGFGPFPYQSQVRETTRFMDVMRLLDVRANPEKSRQIQHHMVDLITTDQERKSVDDLVELAQAGQPIVLKNQQTGETYTVQTDVSAASRFRPRLHRDDINRITFTSGTLEQPGIEFRKDQDNATALSGKAREIVISMAPDSDTTLRTIHAQLEVRDATLNYEGQTLPVRGREWNVPVAMSDPVAAIANRTAYDFYNDPDVTHADRMKTFRVDFARQQNRIEGELHSRFGFAFSCFILSIVGATIGMMTRSGNFVTAFAVCVGPALVAIVLIVTGQHICETPPRFTQHGIESPLELGLTVLWSGNVVVVALGSALFYKLSRT